MTAYELLRTDSSHADFLALVRLLDAELAVLDGEDHAFYAQYNRTDKIRHCVVAYDQGRAVGCGAIRPIDTTAMEVKRMFVLPDWRRKGVASTVLTQLERWCTELGYPVCRLETGKRQPEAIALYHRHGYKIIPNYGQYEGMDNSVCFEKHLKL